MEIKRVKDSELIAMSEMYQSQLQDLETQANKVRQLLLDVTNEMFNRRIGALVDDNKS